MNEHSDFLLAKHISEKLKGKFWEVTLGEWWVVVQGISSQRLVIWTNDPFGIAFTPRNMNMGLLDLQKKVMTHLLGDGIVLEDGSWGSLYFENVG